MLKGRVFLEFLHDIDELLLRVYPSLVLTLVQLAKTARNFIKTVYGEIVLNEGKDTSAICLVNAPC